MMGPIGGFGIPPVSKGTSDNTTSATAGKAPEISKAPAPEGTAAQKKTASKSAKTQNQMEFQSGGMAVTKAASPAPAAKRAAALADAPAGPTASSGFPAGPRTAKQVGLRTNDEILEDQERLAKLRATPDAELDDDERAERDELVASGTDARPARSRGPGRTSGEISAAQDRLEALQKKGNLSKKERTELDELNREYGGRPRIRTAPEGARTSAEINEENKGRSGMSISQGKTIDGDPNSKTYGQEIEAEPRGVGPAGEPGYKAFPVDVEADKEKFGSFEAELKPGAKVSKKTLDELRLRTEWPFVEATQKKTGKSDYANEEEYVQKKLAKSGSTRSYIGQSAAETVELPSNYNFYYSLAQTRRNLGSEYGSRGIDLPEAPPRPSKEARGAVESKPPAPTATEYGLPAKGSVSPRDIDTITAKETFRSLQAYERERIPPSAWKYTSESDYVADALKNRSYSKADKVTVDSGDKLLERIRANVRNLMSAYYGPEATAAYAAPEAEAEDE